MNLHLRHTVVSLALILALNACGTGSDPLIANTRAFVAAFNGQDAAAMGELAHPEIEWLSANGSRIEAGTVGREALLAEMQSYFDGDFSTTSELLEPIRHGQFVTATEAASWQSKGQTRRQCSVVVYEYEGKLIRRVTYYPAWNC